MLDVPHLVNLHDVRVNQRRGGLGLDLEPLQIGGVAGQLGAQNLHHHPPFQAALLGQIDLGHRPAAQPFKQLEIAQLPAGKIGVGGRFRRRRAHVLAMRHKDFLSLI